jgi:peptide/nickel transport system ATP-binding protein
VNNLTVAYSRSGRSVEAVRNVSFAVESGDTLGIVGETGSGKSSVGLAIMRLLPSGATTAGQVLLDDEDLLTCSERRMRQIRGRTVGMVFQDALSALDPVFPIHSQLVETIRRHKPELHRREARKLAGDALEELAIPRSRLRSYPHEFSGGMRQRAMMATALAPAPQFLIADESTSDLDTVNQRQVLDVLAGVQRDRGLGLIVVSHDLAVIHHMCKNLVVLYRGDLVESGPTKEVLSNPTHWYTKGLVQVSARKRDSNGRFFTLPRVGASIASDSNGVAPAEEQTDDVSDR